MTEQTASVALSEMDLEQVAGGKKPRPEINTSTNNPGSMSVQSSGGFTLPKLKFPKW